MAAGDDDLSVHQRRGTLQLVTGEHDGDTSGRGVPDEIVEDVAPAGVEPGMGLVEQPQGSVTDEEGGEAGPPALPGREPGDLDIADPHADTGAVHGDGRITAAPHGSGPVADVLGDGEVVVEPGGMTEQRHLTPDGSAVAPEVVAEDRRLAPNHGHQAGDGAEQGRLAGAVGAADQHDLAGSDVEVDAGEGGETAEQADRGAEVDDGVHANRGKRYARGRVVAAFGRALIAFGLLVLLFVAYELWGTGLAEARSQQVLRKQFAPVVQSLQSTAPTSPTTAPPAPVPGDAVALIRIPRIGVDKAVVEGVGVPDLKKGPGHYPGSPMPGQPGNAAIAGHRTTYGAPFYRLDDLHAGDDIEVTTRQGLFHYRVESTRTVAPDDFAVLDPTVGAQLTLTTCTPRFSASNRLVVVASLVGDPAPAPPPPPPAGTTPPTVALAGLSGGRQAAWPTALWGAAAALVALLTWLAARRWRRWPAYVLGAPVFLVVLFVFYENVARVLPANI